MLMKLQNNNLFKLDKSNHKNMRDCVLSTKILIREKHKYWFTATKNHSKGTKPKI